MPTMVARGALALLAAGALAACAQVNPAGQVAPLESTAAVAAAATEAPAALETAPDVTAVVAAADGGEIEALRRLLAGGLAEPGAPELAESLVKAAGRGDAQVAAALVDAGLDVNVANRFGYTALQAAVTRGQVEAALAMIERGGDISRSSEGTTLLIEATKLGEVALVGALIEAGAPLEERDALDQDTALLWAAYQGHAAVVELLLAEGADVNVGNRRGETPLFWAESRGHAEVAAILREAGGTAERRLEP